MAHWMLRKLSGFYQNILESNVNSWNKKSSNSRIIFQERHVVFKRDILIPTRYLYLENNLDLLIVWLSRFSFSEEIFSPCWKYNSCEDIVHLTT